MSLAMHSMDRLPRNLDDLRLIVQNLTTRSTPHTPRRRALAASGQSIPQSGTSRQGRRQDGGRAGRPWRSRFAEAHPVLPAGRSEGLMFDGRIDGLALPSELPTS